MKHKKVPSHTQINWPVYQDVKSNRLYVVLEWGKVSLTKRNAIRGTFGKINILQWSKNKFKRKPKSF